MATHSSILAWRIAWMEGLHRLQSVGLQRVTEHNRLAKEAQGSSSSVLLCSAYSLPAELPGKPSECVFLLK